MRKEYVLGTEREGSKEEIDSESVKEKEKTECIERKREREEEKIESIGTQI